MNGPAILGFKTAETYRLLLADRLGAQTFPVQPRQELINQLVGARTSGRIERDIDIDGEPSSYFRFVANHRAVPLTRRQRVDLFNIDSGRVTAAPGYIDFIPSPDGRLFVTPETQRRGLNFFHESQLFDVERSAAAEPRFIDRLMRDQYPSIGLLSGRNDSRAHESTYRVLISWTERAMFRDYVVRPVEGGGGFDITPINEPVIACPQFRISLPILSRNGRELAGRDETTGTTKLFELKDDGSCKEILDLGLSTGKLAWSPNGDRLAFSLSNGTVRDRFGFRLPERQLIPGVFVLHRGNRTFLRVAGSENLDHLVFPDFIDSDHLVFLARIGRAISTLRIVCCFS
jgi:hypothetical protein